jgi:cytochrome b6-f complex iron-sulfur subunit
MNVDRRTFVIAAAAAGACACCAPQLLAQQQRNENVKVDVGTLADYAKDGLYDAFLKPNKILLVRGGDKLYALNGVCTHKACTVRIKEEKIVCPCHGSTFSNDGVPSKDPAKASLFRHAISLDSSGRIIVDRSKRFGEKEWSKPESFVAIKEPATT